MKTLKQHLQNKGYSTKQLSPDDLTHWNEIKYIQNIVKKWLQERQKDVRDIYKRLQPKTDNQRLYLEAVLCELDKLIEELEQ